jgi:CelD/BcsL family acetyltransferase involved in cellulose biosynthesis
MVVGKSSGTEQLDRRPRKRIDSDPFAGAATHGHDTLDGAVAVASRPAARPYAAPLPAAAPDRFGNCRLAHPFAGRALAMTIEWITEESDFMALADAWETLLPSDARPFDLHAWYRCWWSAFGGSSRLAVCTAWSGNELTAVCPLGLSGRRSLRALANLQTPVFRPLARDASAMRRLAEALTDGGTAALDMWGLPVGDPSVAAVEEAAAGAGMLRLREDLHVSPIVATDGDLGAWRAASKPRWGAPLERFRRKMTREHEASLDIVEPPGDLEAELDAGFEVEASGWKGRAGTAITSSAETQAFYRDVARAFAARGELRLSRVILDGATAAFDLCLLRDRRLYLLKTGYDEGFRKLAPGLVMRLSVIERCFELGYEAHELLGEDSEWKLKFATTERRHVGLRAYARRPLPLAGYTYRAAIRPRLKRAYRSVRPHRK